MSQGGYDISSATHALSDHELKILALIGSGYQYAEIARALSYSPSTVKAHVRNILRKLGVRNRVEAVVTAVRQGILDPQTIKIPDRSPTLTNREQEVVRLMSRGASDGEIAISLGISSETVKTHMRNILRKLGVSRRTLARVYWLTTNGERPTGSSP